MVSFPVTVGVHGGACRGSQIPEQDVSVWKLCYAGI